VNAQDVQAPAGQVGQQPAPAGEQFQHTVQVKGRLTSVQEFGDIIVRANPDGSFVHVRDVARVELAAQTYNQSTRLNRQPAVSIAIYQLPTANALEVAKGVRATLAQVARTFPPGVEYRVPLDTTAFVTASIGEVEVTLFIALLLVFVVVYLFLQSWRATLVPAVAVPVSLIGTGAAFAALGFSINTLTLFGLVLAVGLVVDDAIVLVEAVQLHIDEDHMTPKDAAIAAMNEVSGPVVAVALVLTAVFVPVAFLGGITGQLYKQFALTLAVSVLISAFEALTLSPPLCGGLRQGPRTARRATLPLRLFRRRAQARERSLHGGRLDVPGGARRRTPALQRAVVRDARAGRGADRAGAAVRGARRWMVDERLILCGPCAVRARGYRGRAGGNGDSGNGPPLMRLRTMALSAPACTSCNS
jgi:multidrug efflux pump subunit AcrB